MAEVMNIYRALRGKGTKKDLGWPSRLMARTRVGVCPFLHTAVNAIINRAQRGMGDRPSRITARPRGGVRSYALAVSAKEGVA